MLPKHALQVNTDLYQREHTLTKVKEIAARWSWVGCGALTVAFRDNAYWVVDGQHRLLAAMRRSDIQDLPCVVFFVEDAKDEAEGFLIANTNRKPITALAKFKAQLATGDTTAANVQRALAKNGLKLGTNSHSTGVFNAVQLAMTIATADLDGFEAVLGIAAPLAKAEQTGVHARIIEGLYYIHCRIDGGVLNRRLRDRINQVGQAALLSGIAKAAAYYERGGAKIYADGILQTINARLQNRFELNETPHRRPDTSRDPGL
jgi:hypothetical protein